MKPRPYLEHPPCPHTAELDLHSPDLRSAALASLRFFQRAFASLHLLFPLSERPSTQLQRHLLRETPPFLQVVFYCLLLPVLAALPPSCPPGQVPPEQKPRLHRHPAHHA